MSLSLQRRHELMQLMEGKLAKKARKSLLSFAQYTRPEYQANWHHKKLCSLLDRFVSGDAPRVMVFMPPQHGKSELVSRCLPAYIHGVDPNASIIATSYAADLSSRMNRDVQRIMDSEEYGRVFPDTHLSNTNVRTVAKDAKGMGSWLRNNSIFEIVQHRGSYRSAGVGGGITGMGGDFLIIDDPIKSQEDAYSPVYRDKVWDWYISTFYSRRRGDHAGVLITLTRWHEDDLAGRLLRIAANDPNADQWEVLSFPALKEGPPTETDPREIDEPLWPDRFGKETLLKNKANGEYFWNSLYQQRPSSPEGAIIKREWLRFYDHLPEDVTDWIQVWDLTFKETKKGSFVVGQVWARRGAEFYLVDQYRDRTDFPGSIRAIRSMTERYPQAAVKLVEDAANGPAILATLRDEIPGLIAVPTKGASKESRFHSVTPFFEAGNVWFPNLPWTSGLVEEVVSFPGGSNDDQVDGISMALNRYKNSSFSGIKLNLDFGLKEEGWRY